MLRGTLALAALGALALVASPTFATDSMHVPGLAPNTVQLGGDTGHVNVLNGGLTFSIPFASFPVDEAITYGLGITFSSNLRHWQKQTSNPSPAQPVYPRGRSTAGWGNVMHFGRISDRSDICPNGACSFAYQTPEGVWHGLYARSGADCAPYASCYRTDDQTGIRAVQVTSGGDYWRLWTADGVERVFAHHITEDWHCLNGEPSGWSCQSKDDFRGWYTTRILDPKDSDPRHRVHVEYDAAYPHCLMKVWDTTRGETNPTFEFVNDDAQGKQPGGITNAVKVRVGDTMSTYQLTYQWVAAVPEPCTYDPNEGGPGGAGLDLPLLTFVKLQDSSTNPPPPPLLTWELTYSSSPVNGPFPAWAPVDLDLPGYLADGQFTWECIPYEEMPARSCNCGDIEYREVYGVTEKKVVRSSQDCNGGADCWTFERFISWPDPDPCSGPGDTDFPCGCPGTCASGRCTPYTNPHVVKVTLPVQQTASGLFQRDQELHYFNVGCSDPFESRQNGLLRRVETFDGEAVGTPLRRRIIDYQADSTGDNYVGDHERTEFLDVTPTPTYVDVLREDWDGYGHFQTVTEATNEGTGAASPVIRRRTETPYSRQVSDIEQWFLGRLTSRRVFDDVTGVRHLQVTYDWDSYGRLLREIHTADPTGTCCSGTPGDVHVHRGWDGHQIQCQAWSGGDDTGATPISGTSLNCASLTCTNSTTSYAATQSYANGAVSSQRPVGMGWDSFRADRFLSGAAKREYDPWSRYSRQFTLDPAGRVDLVRFLDYNSTGEEDNLDPSWLNSTELTWQRVPQSPGPGPAGYVKYDLYGRRAEVRLADPRSTPTNLLPEFRQKLAHDAFGNRTETSFWCTTNSCSKLAYMGYDPFGRPRRVERDGTALATFSHTGLTTDRNYWQREPGGECVRTVTEVRDGFGRLTKVIDPLPTYLANCGDPGARTTTYSYDPLNRLVEVEQCVAGGSCQTRSFDYDGLGNLRQSVEPERGIMNFERYDAKGNLLRENDSSETHDLAYDCAGRLTSENWTNECRQRLFSYDQDGALTYPGRRVKAVAQGANQSSCMTPVEERYRYDGVSGRLSQVTSSINGHDFVQSVTWNTLGLPSQQTYPSSASDVDNGLRSVLTLAHGYQRGFLNTLASSNSALLGSFVTSISYDPSQAWKKIEFPPFSGLPIQLTRTRDSFNRIKSILGEAGGIAPLNLTLLDYDRSGNIQGINDASAPNPDYFAYAGRGELLAATYNSNPPSMITYGYDGLGNLLSRTGLDQVTLDVDPATNRITSSGFDYSPSGDLEQTPAGSFVYDRFHQLREATVAGFTSAYEYDADGFRVLAETDNACPASQVYSLRGPDGTLLSQFREDPACPGDLIWLRDYVYANDAFVSKVQSTTLAPPSLSLNGPGPGCSAALRVADAGTNLCRSVGVQIFKTTTSPTYDWTTPWAVSLATPLCPLFETHNDPNGAGACYRARAVHQNGDLGPMSAEVCTPPCNYPYQAQLGLCPTLPPPVQQNQHKRYCFTDHLGSPRAVVHYTGLLLDRASFGPFGETRDPNLCQERLHFTGHEHDQETGLDYMKARLYDRMIGRFMSVDPVGGRPSNPPSWNRYAYALGNPLMYVDPFGLESRATVQRDSNGNYIIQVVDDAPPDEAFLRFVYDTLRNLGTHADVDANIRESQRHRGRPFWFRSRVRNKAPWDYKQRGLLFEPFGNFNYGATGGAVGFPLSVLLRQAGRAQVAAGTSDPNHGSHAWFGLFGGTAPYGDDPLDQVEIVRGFRYWERYLEDHPLENQPLDPSPDR